MSQKKNDTPVTLKARRGNEMTTVITKCATCNSDIVDRGEFIEPVCPNGDQMNKEMYLITRAIKKHFYRLDQRSHGVVSMDKAFEEICEVLALSWKQGEMTEFLEKHPKLKPFYEAQ